MIRLVRALLVVLSVPGVVVTVYAGLIFMNLLVDQLVPDPANIAHGMGMAHAFIPSIFWMVVGILYLAALWIVGRTIGRIARRKTGSGGLNG